MANEVAKIDNNYKKTLLGVTDDASAEIRRILVDPTTGRLKCSAIVTATFLSLSDTPSAYTGQSGKVVAVKATEDGLEFTAAGSIDGSGTANEIAYWVDSNTLGTLAVATYPSLTELAFLKGTSSAIQTQLNAKGAGDMLLGTAQSVTETKTFTNSKLTILGSSTGKNTFTMANSSSSDYVTTVPAVTGTVALGTGTANELAYWSATNALGTLAVATYPSLTEISYIKGLSSAVQTQLNAKGDMVLDSVQSVTGLKTFDTTKLAVKGSSTGTTAIASANAGATAYTQTLPARDGTIANLDNVTYIGTTSVALNRASAALTLAGITLTTPDIGTPSAGVLTNATGLPAASVVAGVLGVTGTRMTKLWATDIESTNAPTAGGVAIPTISSTNTLTNKRITVRTGTTTSSTTPTINTDDVNFYSLTAQAADITSFTTNLSGTPTEAQTLWIAITGTAARAIAWGTSFEASTVALPTTTVTTARLDVGFVWNTVTSKWRCIAVA